VTFFFGDNASGNTALLEVVVRLSGLNLEGGGSCHDFSNTGRSSQLAEAIRLHGRGITMSRGSAIFYRADQFAHFVHTVPMIENRKKKVGADLQVLSHGKSFHKLIDICFDESGLYLLDEPEVADGAVAHKHQTSSTSSMWATKSPSHSGGQSFIFDPNIS